MESWSISEFDSHLFQRLAAKPKGSFFILEETIMDTACIQVNTYLFEQGKKKLEMYIATGKTLNCENWDDLCAYRQGDSVVFYNGCDLVFEFGLCNYDENLTNATMWLFAGAPDPLRIYK
jgi:hypothetical protein